jgi:hypothetical protein
MSNVQGGIYQIRCLANGKVYVGSAADLRRRWGRHRRALSIGKHVNGHLQAAWLKHGIGINIQPDRPEPVRYTQTSFLEETEP